MRDDTRVSLSDAHVVRVSVRVKPGSSRTRVGGRYSGGPHGDALVIAVTAPAVDGRANEAVCAALAKELGMAPRDVVVLSGARGRTKVLGIASDLPGSIRARLDELMGPTGVSGQARDLDPA